MSDQEQPEPLGFLAEWRDSVSPRTVLLIVGVLLLQLGFILSYVGAFHAPKPHRIPIAVVAPAPLAGRTVSQLNAIAGSPLKAAAVADRATAEQRIRDGKTASALVINPQASTDTLLTASAAGTSIASAVTEVIGRVEASQQRSVTSTDLVPVQPGDGRGLTGFYLVIGWIVGGYLVAALLGVARGARPATPRRAIFRLAAIVPYSIVSGFGGALVVDQVLGALTGHFLALWWLGALLVAAAAAVTMAFQVLFGVFGIGVTVLVFVVLGNPTAGGAYQPALLPPFWRALSGALPNGAGTDSVRRIGYFHSNGIGGHLRVIAVYLIAGVAVAIAGSHLLGRREQRAAG
ncbi:MAG: DUF3533 domain-containing protein [Jatrophihabitantaceae bacterium]